MIKDWIKGAFLDDDGVIEWPPATEYVAPPPQGTWTTNVAIGQEHIAWPQAPVITGPLTLTMTLRAVEAPDKARFTMVAELTMTLRAVEAPDKARFTMEAEAEEEPPTGWSEYIWPVWMPLRMRLRAKEAPDRARFRMEFDYTDEDLVMSLMMAAWDEDDECGMRIAECGMEEARR